MYFFAGVVDQNLRPDLNLVSLAQLVDAVDLPVIDANSRARGNIDQKMPPDACDNNRMYEGNIGIRNAEVTGIALPDQKEPSLNRVPYIRRLLSERSPSDGVRFLLSGERGTAEPKLVRPEPKDIAVVKFSRRDGLLIDIRSGSTSEVSNKHSTFFQNEERMMTAHLARR
jgi:hypothetical protein